MRSHAVALLNPLFDQILLSRSQRFMRLHRWHDLIGIVAHDPLIQQAVLWVALDDGRPILACREKSFRPVESQPLFPSRRIGPMTRQSSYLSESAEYRG